MTDIVWLDENETEPRKQNFAIRQLLERVPELQDDVAEIETDITELSDAIAAIGGPPVAPAAFSAHKNGTAQSGIADNTLTQITFGTEVYDVGNHFASHAWTPPSGKVCMSAATILDGNTIAAASAVAIYKNGSLFKLGFNPAVVGLYGLGQITIDDIANGSDVYTVYAAVQLASGTATARGTSPETYFMGHWISA